MSYNNFPKFEEWYEMTQETHAAFGDTNIRFDLIDFVDSNREFNERTFGTGLRTKGLCAHITKELVEIQADPTDTEEWIDILLLAIDGARRTGASGQYIADMLSYKMAKNKQRKWPSPTSEDVPIEHVRD